MMEWEKIANKIILTNVPNYYISDENCENLYYKALANHIDRVFIGPTSTLIADKFKKIGVKTAVSIAYPSGCAYPELKVQEIKNCEDTFAADMYFVTAAIGYFMSGHKQNLKDEMKLCVEAAVNKPVYFIAEASEMSDKQLETLCETAKITNAAGIINSTAFMPYDIRRTPSEDTKRLRQFAGSELEVFISGGFKTKKEVENVINNGADAVIVNTFGLL